jgi:hypothetical protein
MKHPQTVWTNGKISLGNDLIFGPVVLTEEGWHPVDDVDDSGLELILKLIDNNPGCLFLDKIREIKLKRKEESG